jgi:hypothetical protein
MPTDSLLGASSAVCGDVLVTEKIEWFVLVIHIINTKFNTCRTKAVF